MTGKYRTIVADPPWEYNEGFALGPGHGNLEVRPLPYKAMSLSAIHELPVFDLAAKNSRLFMWTTNRYLRSAFSVLEAWGFIYRQTLVWHKLDANLPASIAPNSAEFLMVATKGRPERTGTMPSSVVATTRKGGHSAKPEVWLDYIEQCSPGPYVELFARRARFGWDYWGDQSLGTAEMAA
jgi:N6-adenosine-specific RNA methylase IME4